MSDDAELLKILAGLRAQYLREAPERLSQLRATLAQARCGDGAALAELRLQLHRLAGSGGSYGLQDVTDTARRAEHVARELLDAGATLAPEDIERLQLLVEAVGAAFREAGAPL
jgi:HPt (histidine-containing phosphotransfer) domain-containing protein